MRLPVVGFRSPCKALGTEVLSALRTFGFFYLHSSPVTTPTADSPARKALAASSALLQISARAAEDSKSVSGKFPGSIVPAEANSSSPRGIYAFSQGSSSSSSTVDKIIAFQMGCEEKSLFDLRKAYFEKAGYSLSMEEKLFLQRTCNVWPDSPEHFQECKDFKESLTQYFSVAEQTCLSLLESIEMALEKPIGLASMHCKSDHSLEAKLYKKRLEDGERFNAHKDLSTLTLLVDDSDPEAPGGCLQVLDDVEGIWHPAKPLLRQSGLETVLVNAGEFLPQWANCKSCVHKVVGPSPADRTSIAYFFAPNWEAEFREDLIGDSMPYLF